MARILVTGATGYIGRHVVARLLAGDGIEGAALRVLARSSANSTAHLDARLEVAHGSVTNGAEVTAAMAGVTHVVHLAALTANIKQRPGSTYAGVNTQGTRNLVTAAVAQSVERIVLISGIGAVANGERSWIRTRWEGEQAVRTSGLPYTILQPSVLFGDGGEFFAAQERVVKQAPVAPIIGSPDFRYQPIWVEDVCTCILRSLTSPTVLNQTVAIGGPAILTARQVIDLIQRRVGTRKPVLSLPLGLMKIQASLIEALLPTPPLTRATVELFELGDNVTALDSVQRHFGFAPRDLVAHMQGGVY